MKLLEWTAVQQHILHILTPSHIFTARFIYLLCSWHLWLSFAAMDFPLQCTHTPVVMKREPNASYVCSQYYRAPELIFRAKDYTSDIGRWLVFIQISSPSQLISTEILLEQPIFPLETGMNQLVEVIKVMAPPGIRWIHRAGLAIEVEKT